MIERKLMLEHPYHFKQFVVAAAMILIATGCHFLPFRTEFFKEWVPFFLIGSMIPIILYAHQRLVRSPTAFSSNMKLFCSLGIGMLVFVIMKAYNTLWTTVSLGALIWISSFTLYASWSVSKTICHIQWHFSKQRRLSLVFAACFIFTLTAWFALFQLPNWKAYCESLKHHGFMAIVYSIICFSLAKYYVFEQKNDNLKASSMNKFQQNSLYVVAFLFFILLGFRSDSLFSIDGSAFHWAYFVGPTETIRSHGWLLWDTPSQYGFLNILISATLPTKSSWQAIYLLQSVLLVAVAVIFFHIINQTKNFFRACLGLFIIISSLHFADPILEGPAPFPSSSVMRFFWCYVFIFLLYKYWKSERFTLKKFAYYGSFCWVFSVLWSAESAIYCSCAFFPALLVSCVQHTLTIKDTSSLHQRRFTSYLYLGLPFIFLLIALLSISIYYQISIGHYPNWSNLFLYGVLYAGGFGSYPLNPTGAVWILLLLLIAMMTLTASITHENKLNRSLVLLAGLIGCLWAISSYFVGRAVPNNITAILPILTLILLISLQINSHQLLQRSVLIIQAIAVPFLFIVMITVLGNPSLWSMIKNFKSLSSNIDKQIPISSSGFELLEVMRRANIKPTDFIAYSGNSALPPRPDAITWVGEQVWLPSPLQLLEQPVPITQQQLTLHRFIMRLKPQLGYLIHAKGEAEDRYLQWLNLLNVYYIPTATFENTHWVISQFNLKVS